MSDHTAILNWATDYLISNRHPLKALPKIVIKTPWSFVARFHTKEDIFYLKQTPKALALEAPITQILHDQFQAPVPEVIASNSDLDCFLMKDAGRPLREILKQHFDAKLLCQAIEQFTSLQIVVAHHIQIFLDMGVPDWRLDQLPNLCKRLLSQKEILLADGLTETEFLELENLMPLFTDLCQKLSSYKIPESIVQCDFHDNNILVDEHPKKLTLIDLGEIVISHPFFSLVGCLRQAKRHHGLSEKEADYQQLQAACLHHFSPFGSQQTLLDAFKIAEVLWFVYESLGQIRLRQACDETAFLAFQRPGKLVESLKGFMTACSAIAR